MPTPIIAAIDPYTRDRAPVDLALAAVHPSGALDAMRVPRLLRGEALEGGHRQQTAAALERPSA